MFSALLTSGHASYVVLTESLTTPVKLAILAAIVIDLAAIWMGAHAAELAEAGDRTRVVNIYTGFIMLLSLSMNFMYGYTTGTWVTGLLACIYPVIAMVTYERWIQHKIHAARKRNGMVLPQMPAYVTGKFQNKAAVTQLKRDYATATIEDAQAIMRYRFDQRRRELVTNEVTPVADEVTRLQATVTSVTDQVTPVTSNDYTVTNEVTPVTDSGYTVTPEVTDEVTELQNIFATVTKEHAEVTGLPEWLHLDMTETSEVTQACVAHGVTDFPTVKSYINKIKEGATDGAIKTSLHRAKARVSNSR